MHMCADVCARLVAPADLLTRALACGPGSPWWHPLALGCAGLTRALIRARRLSEALLVAQEAEKRMAGGAGGLVLVGHVLSHMPSRTDEVRCVRCVVVGRPRCADPGRHPLRPQHCRPSVCCGAPWRWIRWTTMHPCGCARHSSGRDARRTRWHCAYMAPCTPALPRLPSAYRVSQPALCRGSLEQATRSLRSSRLFLKLGKLQQALGDHSAAMTAYSEAVRCVRVQVGLGVHTRWYLSPAVCLQRRPLQHRSRAGDRGAGPGDAWSGELRRNKLSV